MTELRTGTRKGFVVILVPNGENVRMDFIGGTRKVFAVWGHAEFAEGTGKRHTQNSLWVEHELHEWNEYWIAHKTGKTL